MVTEKPYGEYLSFVIKVIKVIKDRAVEAYYWQISNELWNIIKDRVAFNN